jgi:hypothetical protein
MKQLAVVALWLIALATLAACGDPAFSYSVDHPEYRYSPGEW